MQSVVWQALDHWDNRGIRDECLSKAAGMLAKDSPFGEYLAKLARGTDPLELFRQRFLENYDVSRQFTQDATLKSAVRINRVLGGMARGYFPRDAENVNEKAQQSSKRKWKQRIAILLGKRLLTFTEAAIQPDGPARSRHRWRIIAGYLLSIIVVALACLPAYLLLQSAARPWPALGFLAIFIVTLLIAGFPLLLTIAYHYAWFRLKRKLDAVLPRTRSH
jgi:hypothetical protein